MECPNGSESHVKFGAQMQQDGRAGGGMEK